MDHKIIKADSLSNWTYCTVCFKDVSANGERHYRTSAKVVEARKSLATPVRMCLTCGANYSGTIVEHAAEAAHREYTTTIRGF